MDADRTAACHVERPDRDRARVGEVEPAAVDRHREPAGIGERPAEARGAAEGEAIRATARKIELSAHCRCAGQRNGVSARAEADVTGIDRVSAQREPVVARPEARRARDASVRHVENVIARSEQDRACNARRSCTRCDDRLAYGRADIAGAEVDRDGVVRTCLVRLSGDAPAVFDQGHRARAVDDRARDTIADGCRADRAAVDHRLNVRARIDRYRAHLVGVGSAARRRDAAGDADRGDARPCPDTKRRGVAVDRLGGDLAVDAHAARNGHRAAEAADHKTVAVDAFVEAGPQDAAVDDNPVARGVARRRADRGRGGGRAYNHRRCGAVGGDECIPLLRVLDPVIVLVVVRGAAVLRTNVENNPPGDIARDANRRPALEQVVRVELRRVGGRREQAIAGRGDGVLDAERAADIAVERDGDRILPLRADGAGDADIAADVAGADAVAVVADHLDAAAVGQRAGKRPGKMDAVAVIAFHLDAAAVGDRAAEGARGADASAARALGERAVIVAVLVGVGGRVALVDDDLAAVADRARDAGIGVDARRVVRAGDLDRALVLDAVVAVDRDRVAARGLHRARAGDADVVGRAVLDRRGGGRRRAGVVDIGFGLSLNRNEHQRGEAGAGEKMTQLKLPC